MPDSFKSKYKVLQKIGEGSFSEVLRCEDRLTGTQYAAKCLKKSFETTNDVMSCSEIMAMHKLSRHPNVLYVIEYFYESGSGSLIYVFELMDMSIYEFMKLKTRCLPETKIKGYFYQMLKGLEYLHSNGLFHRDIKPENVLVKLQNPNNNLACHQIQVVKLADLGSIRSVYSQPPYTEYISTRWYRSPECLLSIGYYGPKMDVWACGCVFYEMLTLKPLFAGNSEIDQLAKIHAVLGTPSVRLLNRIKQKSHNCANFPRQTGTGLRQFIGGFSEDAQNVMQLMIQYDPENRINARRLIDHKYFASLKERQRQFCCARFLDNLRQARGDHQVQLANYFEPVAGRRGRDWVCPIPDRFQCRNATPRRPMRIDQKISNNPLASSQTSTDMNKRSKIAGRQFNDWGVNPTSFQPKKLLNRSSSTLEHPVRPTFCQSKRNATLRNLEELLKTTSNFPVRLLNPQKITPSSSTGKRQFQSKSFVLPRRGVEVAKMETISECCTPILSGLNNKF